MSSGFATPEGTQAFFMREGADLPLHHQFEVSGLFVNPIIHGPPLRPLSKKKEEVYMLQALSKHKSNAFFVYDHHTGSYGSCLQEERGNKKESWAAESFGKILQVAGAEREEVVTIAGLGRMSADDEDFDALLKERLAEARDRSGVGNIDYAVIELDAESFSRGGEVLDNAVIALESLCSAQGEGKELQGYGIHLAVEPYVYHSPAQAKSGALAVLPSMVESGIGLKHYEEGQMTPSHAEMMLYGCSPSTALPATYPMLEPPIEVWDNSLVEPPADIDLDSVEGLSDQDRAEAELMKTRVRALSEQGRRFSRVALNPLHTFRGAPAGAERENPAAHQAELVEGQGVGEEEDVDFLGELSRQWEARHDEEEQQQQKQQQGSTGTASTSRGGVAMSPAAYTEGAPVVLLESPYRNPNVGARTPSGRAAIVERQELHAAVGAALDELCPPLGDGASPRLQQKAFRAVLSVGFDAVVVDAESSAHFGKLDIAPTSLLQSRDTDSLFGGFEVPQQVQVPLRE